ncbi:MAG: hypothetical protein H6R19_548 [Proteobacteria bacterium]|nr:hypothetical protein [Pseudomonadota bacterium]
MRTKLFVLSMLLCPALPAVAQLSIGFSAPGLSIGINVPVFPDLVPVPGYPVYYAPGMQSNYFFYDGMYWVFQKDNWYASTWYNGPWGAVTPEAVPFDLLRIPVRYYRHAPAFFRGWQRDAPPRWGEHWGSEWAQHRSGWDQRGREASPERPPLPTYQRQYSGKRYPQGAQQQTLQDQHYRYEARDPQIRQQQHEAPRGREATPAPRTQTAPQRDAPQRAASPTPQQAQPQQQQKTPRAQPEPQSRGRNNAPQGGATPQGRAPAQKNESRQGPGKDREKPDERGPDRK